MRLVKVDNLKDNMKLAKTIYEGELELLKEGTKNLSKYKKRLKSKGVNKIYIQDEISKDIEIKENISEKQKMESRKEMKNTIRNLKNNKRINIDNVQNTVSDLIDELTYNKDIMINMHNLKSKDDYLLNHSVNTAILAIKLSLGLNYTRPKIKKLAIGLLLHDIGKIKISDNILKKNGKLNNEEYKRIQEHPKMGYEILKDYYRISSLSKYVILHHHEEIDGSGYPNAKTEEQLHDFAKIAHIIDVFDALTTNRCYRDRWSNKKAMELIIANTGAEFDEEFVQEFRKHIAIYPNGTEVELNTSQIALVKEQNKSFPERPIIKIIKDKNNNQIKNPQTINLMKKLNVTIIS